MSTKSLLATFAVGLLAAGSLFTSQTAFAQEAVTTVVQETATTTEAVTTAAAAAPAGEAAADAGPSIELFTTNNLWMMIAAALVFIMHLGFACVESGLCRAKNTVNILFKNSLIPCIGIITYAFIGFNLMYPGFADGDSQFWFKFAGFGVTTDAAGVTSAYNPGYTYWTDFLFQAMFAATAATIVSGAVAERVKLGSFLIFSAIFVAIAYPLAGSWKWGGGWLNRMEIPFYDFAGSTLVHSVGGWGALAGVLILGPRLGKFLPNGKIKPILGHSMPLATIGVFLLWLGWFGFNGGSVLSADPGLVSLTLVTTCLAASAGAVGAMVISWIVLKKPDLSMTLNGILAGLVGITAGADQMDMNSSLIIGLVAGVLVVLAVLMFDKIRVDDPVGALSVHLVCGIWGTLAVGLLGAKAGLGQFISQAIGVVAYGVFTFIFAFVLFLIIKAIMGLRVTAEEEHGGLDLGEHGQEAYPDFQSDAERLS